MARKRTTPEGPPRTMRTMMLGLVSARIPFSVHYPTKNSMVITLDGGLTNAQLKVAIEQGAVIGPDHRIIILVPKLSNDG